MHFLYVGSDRNYRMMYECSSCLINMSSSQTGAQHFLYQTHPVQLISV